ncbi:PIN domain-containing protein [Rathayibacter soli]|uniref:PIN domain-containing protein n=1 Tax=Rathayibacter soli TaxID=3144168 RepID=UPI0031F2E557
MGILQPRRRHTRAARRSVTGPGANLRSLDALHLAAAIRIGVEHVVTYDARMADSARALGLSVFAPA